MKKNYLNIKTNKKAYGVYVLTERDLPRVTELFKYTNNPIKFTIYDAELEFSTKDEFGFDSFAAVCVGDYVVCDEGWIRLYTPAAFSHIYRIMPISLWEGADGWTNGDIEESIKANLLKLQADDKVKEVTPEGFPRKMYKREEWFPETSEAETVEKIEEGGGKIFSGGVRPINFMEEYLESASNPGLPFVHEVVYGEKTSEEALERMQWYSEQPWWKEKITDMQTIKFDKIREELEVMSQCGDIYCPCVKSDEPKRPADNVNRVIIDAYRITEDFDEWDFAEWLTPGDKFTLRNNIALNDKGCPVFSNPMVTIFNPKTEGEARVGDMVIRVCAHRYTIQACVPNEKTVD
jgi:hypothetical protein